jgi:hypothetical protein
MKTCPHCSTVIGDLALTCDHCGRSVLENAATVDAARNPLPPSTPEMSSAATSQSSGNHASSQVPLPTVARLTWTTWHVTAAAAAAFVVGAVGLIMSRPALPLYPPALNLAASSPAKAEVGRASGVSTDSAAASRAPKWARTRESGWGSDGSRTVTFQLQAENEVSVWMKRVRPVLAVRCLRRLTEVFIVTDSATSIESTPDRHTVRVGFDGQPEIAEQWLVSEGQGELFAPDGVALARQLARAHTMRFGFTPFNASPVVLEFDVRGFAGPFASVAKTCGLVARQAS